MVGVGVLVGVGVGVLVGVGVGVLVGVGVGVLVGVGDGIIGVVGVGKTEVGEQFESSQTPQYPGISIWVQLVAVLDSPGDSENDPIILPL